jgi:ribosomal-protein-alanine N-acetyltransferase
MMELAQASPGAAQWSRAQYEKLLAESPGGEPQPTRLIFVSEPEMGIPCAGKNFESLGISGCLVAHGIDGEWELENIVVAEYARRCGIGSRLLVKFIDQVRAKKGTSIFLEVRESNRGARALYANAGFESIGVRKNYYSNPTEDAVLYRQALP